MIGETTTVCTECGTDDVDEDEHKGDHTEVCPNCGDIKVRQMAPAASKINLGCGDDYREDWHNVDIQGDAADQRLDLEATPWPWPDDSFEQRSSTTCLSTSRRGAVATFWTSASGSSSPAAR